MTKSKKVEHSELIRELQKVVNEGKVVLGARETKKALKRGDAKLVIHASNCPLSDDLKELCEKGGVPIHEYHANSIELGLTCGKPYSVASLCVLDLGDTDLLRVLESAKSDEK